MRSMHVYKINSVITVVVVVVTASISFLFSSIRDLGEKRKDRYSIGTAV